MHLGLILFQGAHKKHAFSKKRALEGLDIGSLFLYRVNMIELGTTV
jgi:hypothetical protein